MCLVIVMMLIIQYTVQEHLPCENSAAQFVWFFIELGGMVERIVVDLTAQRSPSTAGLEIKY